MIETKRLLLKEYKSPILFKDTSTTSIPNFSKVFSNSVFLFFKAIVRLQDALSQLIHITVGCKSQAQRGFGKAGILFKGSFLIRGRKDPAYLKGEISVIFHVRKSLQDRIEMAAEYLKKQRLSVWSRMSARTTG